MNSINDNNFNEKPLIVIEEKNDEQGVQEKGETPLITIEQDSDSTGMAAGKPVYPKKRRRWIWITVTAVLTASLCIVAGIALHNYKQNSDIGMPVSFTSKQNIEKLKKDADDKVTSEVIMTADSILGVALNLYELKGLKGEISFNEPDSTDIDVYLYSRCSDQTSYDPEENAYLGTLIVNGQQLSEDNSRFGYMALVDGNTVLGVAKDEKVTDYVKKQGGSLFRQYVLVSGGTLPTQFPLHGKVERRAFGRMGSQIYYIESRNKETLWDFADAIREYGFTDAIYITGGTDYSYYRTSDGTLHGIGDNTKYPNGHKGDGLVPWVVFKKK